MYCFVSFGLLWQNFSKLWQMIQIMLRTINPNESYGVSKLQKMWYEPLLFHNLAFLHFLAQINNTIHAHAYYAPAKHHKRNTITSALGGTAQPFVRLHLTYSASTRRKVTTRKRRSEFQSGGGSEGDNLPSISSRGRWRRILTVILTIITFSKDEWGSVHGHHRFHYVCHYVLR